MALLDAWALSRALAGHALDAALPAYVAARRRHILAYQTMSAAFTPQFQSDSLVLPVLRDRLLMPLGRLPLARRALSRLVCGDLVAPVRGLPPPPSTPG